MCAVCATPACNLQAAVIIKGGGRNNVEDL